MTGEVDTRTPAASLSRSTPPSAGHVEPVKPARLEVDRYDRFLIADATATRKTRQEKQISTPAPALPKQSLQSLLKEVDASCSR